MSFDGRETQFDCFEICSTYSCWSTGIWMTHSYGCSLVFVNSIENHYNFFRWIYCIAYRVIEPNKKNKHLHIFGIFVNSLLMKFVSIFKDNLTNLSINCIITHQNISLFYILYRHGVKKFDQKYLIFLLSNVAYCF